MRELKDVFLLTLSKVPRPAGFDVPYYYSSMQTCNAKISGNVTKSEVRVTDMVLGEVFGRCQFQKRVRQFFISWK